MINYYLIKSKGEIYFKASEQAFYDTTPANIGLTIFEEKATREETLNSIFLLNGKENMVCFADDVILTKGWYEIVIGNLFDARALGFSIKDPKTDKISNYGFDIVVEDDVIKTMARMEWPSERENEQGLVRCATFTGCFLAISSKCFELVPNVPLDGCNRLGELLYHVLLERAGGSVLVSPHVIGHYAISTKGKSVELLNSQSYQDEKLIWDNAIEKYNLRDAIDISLITNFMPVPIDFPKNVVVWGAGSIANKVLKPLNLEVDFFISGLAEEDGRHFLGRKIHHFERLKNKKISVILITVEGREEDVNSLINKYIEVDQVFYIKVELKDNVKFYTVARI